MKHYKADISVRRVGVETVSKIPLFHPSVRYSSCLTREMYTASDITEARERAIALVHNPNTPEFQKCLDFYFVPFKTLHWGDWQNLCEPPNETQIHSCSSHPFLVGVFKWIIIILVYEVAEDGSSLNSSANDKDESSLDAVICTDHKVQTAKELSEQGFTDEEIVHEILEEREEILIEDYDNAL